MRVTALGAYRMHGKSKKSGNAYDMAKLICRVPVENMANESMRRVGWGWQVVELDIHPECIERFHVQYPPEGLLMDVTVDSVMQYGRLQSVIVDFDEVAAGK